ncbi:hypothetical protein LguiA_001202 [Lonicera macranthoides]
MDSFDYCWDLIDYNTFIDDVPPPDLYWQNQSTITNIDASVTGATPQDKESAEKECTRKRGRNDSCSRVGTKACRERLRREKLSERQANCWNSDQIPFPHLIISVSNFNYISSGQLMNYYIYKFSELSSILEPGRPARTDKLAIIGDSIRVLNQLKTESQEYKEANERLLEEIKTLKAEKNELREEKLILKAEKEKMEQQLKARTISPPGFMPPHPAPYQAGSSNKMPVFPSYGFVPMWQYLPSSTRDTSHDHELRPPAA